VTAPDQALLAGLATRAGELSDAAAHLQKAFRLSRLMKAVIVIGVLALVGQTVLSLLLLRVAHSNEATGAAIRDCTTPTGKCARRGANATAVAIGSINVATQRAIVAGIECSWLYPPTPTSRKPFERCVTRTLTPHRH
jgi:hypothetical protein